MRLTLNNGAAVAAGGPLDLAQQSLARRPAVQVVARDTRMRFQTTWTGTNPWSITDDASTADYGMRYIRGNAFVTSAGTILRGWVDGSGNVRLQRITDPTNQSQWSHASNAYLTLTWGAYVTSNIGFYQTGSSIYLFYLNSSRHVSYRVSTSDGSSWGAAQVLYAGPAGFGNVAPVSATEVFVASATSYMRISRVTAAGVVDMPWVFSETTEYSLSSTDFVAQSSLDAFVLGGRTFVVWGCDGAGYVAEVTSGMWSEPRKILPDDLASFIPYRVSVHGNVAWLTGRIEFAQPTGLTPAKKGVDVVLRSTDGWNWTALDRECYLTVNETRGKLLLSGNYVYYAGLYRVYRSDATYAIGVDNAARRATITDDNVQASVSMGSAGSAPQFDVTLTQAHIDSAVVRTGAEVSIEAGYYTSAGQQLVSLLTGSIDSPSTPLGPGQRSTSVSGRCLQFKRMKDYESPLYWRLLAQEKTFDTLDTLGDWAGWAEGTQWSVDGTAQRFSSVDQESIYASSVVTASEGFDMRALVSNTYTAAAYYSAFGLIAHMVDKNNHWRVELCWGTFSGVSGVSVTQGMRLVERVNGTDTVRAHVQFAVASGTQYWVRLVARRGRFLAYTRTNGTAAWTQRLNYVQQGGILTRNASREGYAGFYALLRPLRFRIHAANEIANVIGMKLDPDNRWSLWPTSGTMVINGEQIPFTGRTTGTSRMTHHSDANGTGLLWMASNTDANPPQGWSHYVRVSCSVAEQSQSWVNYGLIFTEGGQPGRGWRIGGSNGPAAEGGINLTTVITDASEFPDWNEFPANGWSALIQTGSPLSAIVVPAIYGITRGASAAYHADDSWAYLLSDDILRVYGVHLHDVPDTDYTIEDLLRRTLWFAGATAEFVNLYNASVTATAGYRWLRLDGTADAGAGADALYLDVRDGMAEVMCPSGGGLIIRGPSRNYPSSGQAIILSGSNLAFYEAGALVEQVPLMDTPTYPARLRVTWHNKVKEAAQHGWITVYINGQYAATFMSDTYNGNSANYIGLVTGFTYTSVRVPELGQWRDAVRVDESSDITKVIGDIVQDLPVVYLSRSGRSVKFSFFDTRDVHGGSNPGASLGDVVMSDEYSPQETELMTWIRMEADLVAMFSAENVAGADMLAEHGFIFRNVSLPASRVADGAKIARRLFRRMLEGYGYRTQAMRADVLIEPEDQISFSFTVYGSTLTRAGTMIVDSVDYSIGMADLSMRLGMRKFIE